MPSCQIFKKNKMKQKIILCLVSIFAFTLFAKSQNSISFTYDDSGNRVKREFFTAMPVAPSDPIQEITDVTNLLDFSDVKIFPNPTKGKLRIDIPMVQSKMSGSITLFNTNGKKIFHQNHISNKCFVDLESYNSGMYLLNIVYEDQKLEWKIIKH